MSSPELGPEKFTGDIYKARQYVRDMENMIDLMDPGTTESKKVATACLCLGGGALDWAMRDFDKFTTFEEFIKLFNDRYYMPDVLKLRALMELVDGKFTGNVVETKDKIAECVDYFDDKEELLRTVLLLKNLPPHVRRHLFLSGYQTFKRYTEMAEAYYFVSSSKNW